LYVLNHFEITSVITKEVFVYPNLRKKLTGFNPAWLFFHNIQLMLKTIRNSRKFTVGKLQKNQSGFSILEVLIAFTIIVAIGLVGWYVHSHQTNKSPTKAISMSNSATTTQKQKYLSQDEMVSQLSQQLPADFSYISTPKVRNADLTTNLFGDNTWWVNVPSPNTALTLDFSSPPSGLWQNLSSSQQTTYTKQAQDVINKISATLRSNGYVLKEPPVHMQVGVGFVSDSGDASGYYKGVVGNCTLLRWDTLPVSIELNCAPASLIKTAVDAASPFISSLAAANPSRQLNTVEVESTTVKQTRSNQYGVLAIGSPDSNDTHATDGSNFFVSTGTTWHYLGPSSLCKDTSTAKVNSLLKPLGVNDESTAPSMIIGQLCAPVGP
jgi:Tfp pilus assembly protein PilV